MTGRHACSLCDYARASEHVAVLDPFCPRCGGQIGPAREDAAATIGPVPARLRSMARARWFERGLIAVVVGPLLAAAAKVGWAAAGPGAALGALAVAALLAYVALAPATRHR